MARRLLRADGTPADDAWFHAETAADLDREGPVFVPLALWREQRQRLAGRRVGLRLASSESPAEINADLQAFDAIALAFPVFKDGRAFSHARLLRERYRFKGELRAVGQVLRDQALFMQRCGFDAFEIDEAEDIAGWQQALRRFSVFYQPAADGRAAVAGRRHTRPVAAE